MIVEFLLCDTSLALARSSPTRRYTGYINEVEIKCGLK